MVQPVTAAATPRFAERVSLAAAKASAETAVMGASQPNARPAAALEAAAAAAASAVLTANTASARTSKTIPSPTAMLRASSEAGSTPGPYAYAMPAPARAGAKSATSGWSVLAVATAPAASTTVLAISHGTSNDGVVSNARANPGERSTRPITRSS